MLSIFASVEVREFILHFLYFLSREHMQRYNWLPLLLQSTQFLYIMIRLLLNITLFFFNRCVKVIDYIKVVYDRLNQWLKVFSAQTATLLVFILGFKLRFIFLTIMGGLKYRCLKTSSLGHYRRDVAARTYVWKKIIYYSRRFHKRTHLLINIYLLVTLIGLWLLSLKSFINYGKLLKLMVKYQRFVSQSIRCLAGRVEAHPESPKRLRVKFGFSCCVWHLLIA